MFVVETQVNSFLALYWLTLTTHSFGKGCWGCFAGISWSYQNTPHFNTWPSEHLLKKGAAWWPDNKLCLVTPLIVTPISFQSKRCKLKLLLNLLNSRAKAIPTLCWRLLLLVIQMTMTALPPSSHPKYQLSVHTSLTYQACLVRVTLVTCSKTLQFNTPLYDPWENWI